MSVVELKSGIGEFARDIRVNLGKVLSEEGAPGLSLNQIAGVALASAYATQNSDLAAGILAEFSETLSEAEVAAAKSAASVMAMNNVYYRSIGMISDESYKPLPAGLRMQVVGKPGIEKVDFELYALAVSAVNACRFCVDSHVAKIVAEGVSQDGVQSAIRIAAVLVGASQAMVLS